MTKTECPNCGRKMKSLGNHWSKSKDCDYPELTDVQKETATGLMLGDGTITKNYKNPVLQVKMVNEGYLEHLDRTFGCLGLGVELHKTAEEQSEMNKKSGFDPESDPSGYKDVYRWISRAHPNFNRFREWYTPEKTFPDQVEITPQVLKTWYVCDGGLNEGRVRITSANESEGEKLISYFEDANIPDPKHSGDNLYWSKDESIEVMEYMGTPSPGFEEKWWTRRFIGDRNDE